MRNLSEVLYQSKMFDTLEKLLDFFRVIVWRGGLDKELTETISKSETFNPEQEKQKQRAITALKYWPLLLPTIKMGEKITDEIAKKLLIAKVFSTLLHAKNFLNAVNDFRLLRASFGDKKEEKGGRKSKTLDSSGFYPS